MWEKAAERIVELVKEVVKDYHQARLGQAKIGILMREKSVMKNGREVIGAASKVSAKWQALLKPTERYDFIIWFSKPWWAEASLEQKRALIDHELCHCELDIDGARLRGHDIEEFNEVIERHGIWKQDVKDAAEVFQLPLKDIMPKPRGGGSVTAVTLSGAGKTVTVTERTRRNPSKMLEQASVQRFVDTVIEEIDTAVKTAKAIPGHVK